MTGNEPGTTGANQQNGQQDDLQRTMREAEDDAARAVGEERARAAEAGDEKAIAEQADRPDRLRHAAEWLDGKLVPRLGPAELGPYDEESEESLRSHDACPLCGHAMVEHTIDRSTANAVLNCPVQPEPAPESFEPLNEVGMVKHDPEVRG